MNIAILFFNRSMAKELRLSDIAIIAIEMPHATTKPIPSQHLDLAHLKPIQQAHLT